jgi:hypothetical protein
MSDFAIVRQDGEVDLADGLSVQDVANRYGWPGNGTIEPFDKASHGAHLRHTFTSVEHQGELLNDKPPKKKGDS